MTVRFVQITDHHLTGDGLLWGYQTHTALERVLQHIAAHAGPLDFLVSTGDLTEHGTVAEYESFLTLLQAEPAANYPGPLRVHAAGLAGLPCYVLPGNHDQRPVFLQQLFGCSSTASHLHGSFTINGVQFVVVDWGPRGKAVVDGGLIAWLGRTLSREGPNVLLMHHHVAPVGTAWLDVMIADDVDRFAAQVLNRNVLAMLCGHTHASFEQSLVGIPLFGLRSTCFQFVAGSAAPLRCLQPPHYRIVTIDDHTVTTELVEVPL